MDPLLQQFEKDCLKKGYGRKKWWATQLSVPPLTVSHWLARRQQPNHAHSVKIQEILNQLKQDSHGQAWQDCLWECYYSKEPIPPKILSLLLPEVLSNPQLDSRTLALLSKIAEQPSLQFKAPESNALQNRLGWLLESAGKKAPFSPDPSAPLQHFTPVLTYSKKLKAHFQKQQTRLGKKWRVYDFPIKELKKSLL